MCVLHTHLTFVWEKKKAQRDRVTSDGRNHHFSSLKSFRSPPVWDKPRTRRSGHPVSLVRPVILMLLPRDAVVLFIGLLLGLLLSHAVVAVVISVG